MNKLEKMKLNYQMKAMRESTEQCADLLRHIQSELQLSEEVKIELSKVIMHQKNMVKFFGILEQQLKK